MTLPGHGQLSRLDPPREAREIDRAPRVVEVAQSSHEAGAARLGDALAELVVALMRGAERSAGEELTRCVHLLLAEQGRRVTEDEQPVRARHRLATFRVVVALDVAEIQLELPRRERCRGAHHLAATRDVDDRVRLGAELTVALELFLYRTVDAVRIGRRARPVHEVAVTHAVRADEMAGNDVDARRRALREDHQHPLRTQQAIGKDRRDRGEPRETDQQPDGPGRLPIAPVSARATASSSIWSM